MYDEAAKIFDFLPINKTQTLEEDYIEHLWSSFTELYLGAIEAQPFAVMPFHLLFMVSLQYKILRIYSTHRDKYHTAFTMEHPRDNELDILNPQSVFTIGFLSESKIIDLLKLSTIKPNLLSKMKSLIKNRNENLAHAKGGIELNLDQKIGHYLKCLNELQSSFLTLNDKVAKLWWQEIHQGQEGANFIDLHLAEEYLCPEDMQHGKLLKLETKLNMRVPD